MKQIQISKVQAARRQLRASRRARQRWLRLDPERGINPATGRPKTR